MIIKSINVCGGMDGKKDGKWYGNLLGNRKWVENLKIGWTWSS